MEELEKDRASLTNTLNEINDRVKSSNYQQIDLESVVKKDL